MAEGFIERCSGDDYALGTGIVALSQKVRVNVEIRDRAAPLVRALADLAEESVYLTVREGAARPLHLRRRILAPPDRAHRDRRPHVRCIAPASARRSSATSPEDEIRGIVDRGRPAARHAEHHDEPRRRPRRARGAIRERGFSFDNSENEVGNFCIGAPIFGAPRSVIGGCSIAGTDPEIIAARAPGLAAALKSACLDISRNLGYVPASVAALTLRSAPMPATPSTEQPR